MPDLNDLTAEVAHRARDAAYIAVGLGVLGFQRAQVQRQDLKKRLAGEIDLDERLSELRSAVTTGVSAVTTGVQQLDGLVEGAVQAVEASLQPFEEQLPPAARELAQKAYGSAREVGAQLRQLITQSH